MNLNTEIELINRNKGNKILNTFLPKRNNLDVYIDQNEKMMIKNKESPIKKNK